MKLNNHGWGMKNMIIYCCILLLFLIIAVCNVHSLYKNIEDGHKSYNNQNKQNNKLNNTTNKNKNNNGTTNGGNSNVYIDYSIYHDYEKKMAEVAKSYVIENRDALHTGIASVLLTELVTNGYINQLYDQVNNTECSGYVNVWDDESGTYQSQAYLKCTNYTTEGY